MGILVSIHKKCSYLIGPFLYNSAIIWSLPVTVPKSPTFHSILFDNCLHFPNVVQVPHWLNVSQAEQKIVYCLISSELPSYWQWKTCSFYFNLCLSVMLDSLSCSFTSISFLTTSCSFYFNLCLSVMLDSLSCSFTSISFLTTSCSFTLIYV